MNATRGVDLARNARVADTMWTRLRGLLGRPALCPGEGLVIAPSRGVHTHGMRYPIDIVLVDEGGVVTAVYPELRPWRRTRIHRNARTAIEFPDGVIATSGTRRGDVIRTLPCEREDAPGTTANGGPA